MCAAVAELPSATAGLDSSIVSHLANLLSNDLGGVEGVSVEALALAWMPFLASLGACEDDDEAAARGVCAKLVARLRPGGGGSAPAPAAANQVEEEDLSSEIVAWLERLKLTQYTAKTKAWCNSMGAVHVSEILDNLEDFSDTLGLKPLEVKRVSKARDGGASGAPVTPSTPQEGTSAATSSTASPPSTSSTSSIPRQVQGFFGPEADPQRYAILEELGQGATAVVYKCMRGTDLYAAKTISLGKLRLQPGFQRIADSMRREVSILFSLRHPRIVSLFDVVEAPEGKTPDKLYLVMELVQGCELFDKIVERGALTEPQARYVFIQITEGLQYIHSKDIVYRDLKPENILVDEKNSREQFIEIKLSDFGHSKLINDGYSTALTKVGTPQYWAPEVSEADLTRKAYTQAVDLWSLGVVLYVMVIGSYPFDGVASPMDQQIRSAQVHFRTNSLGLQVSEPCQALIRSLIKVNPVQRLPLVDCLRHRWTELPEGSVGRNLLKLETQGDPALLEERILLPCHPSSAQRDQLNRDLNTWTAKFHCAVRLKKDDKGAQSMVVTSLGQMDMTQARTAKEELLQLVRFNLGNVHVEFMVRGAGDLSVQSGRPNSGGYPGTGSTLTSVREGEHERTTANPFRILNFTLRVHPVLGAGLSLQPEKGGMRVEDIHDPPGQTGLLKMDLITKINEVSLRGTPDTVEEVFGTHFADGAHLAIRRSC